MLPGVGSPSASDRRKSFSAFFKARMTAPASPTSPTTPTLERRRPSQLALSDAQRKYWNADIDNGDDEDDEDVPVPFTPSEYFKRYELMTEFINLRNPSHCPLGVYMMPSTDNLNVWYGALFVHKGYYRSGVFKFRMTIPESYPNSAPSVTFLTDMFHPLVDIYGNLSITQQFPTWRPYQDYIFHALHYVKNIFKKGVLGGLMDKYCLNKEAYRLYRTDCAVFGKLAQQCAQLSITESFLFDHFPDNNLIRFSPLSEAKFDELKSQILKSTTEPPKELHKECTD